MSFRAFGCVAVLASLLLVPSVGHAEKRVAGASRRSDSARTVAKRRPERGHERPAGSRRMQWTSLLLRAVRGPARRPVALRARFERRTYPAPARIPASLRRTARVDIEQVRGQPVYTLTPRIGVTGVHIIYTHGGAFVHALSRPHWRILEQLLRSTGATLVVPTYPLAPEHDHTATLPLLETVYRKTIERVGSRNVVLAGDSAGGNLALVQALRYRDDPALPLPRELILFAPWLDLTMSNPDIKAIEPRDPMLRRSHLAEFGRWWAGRGRPGALHPRDGRLSPLFADDLGGLPPIRIYQGTEDILLPDARLLRDRVQRAGGKVTLEETPGAFHVFMGAVFTPEARKVFRDLAGRLGPAGGYSSSRPARAPWASTR